MLMLVSVGFALSVVAASEMQEGTKDFEDRPTFSVQDYVETITTAKVFAADEEESDEASTLTRETSGVTVLRPDGELFDKPELEDLDSLASNFPAPMDSLYSPFTGTRGQEPGECAAFVPEQPKARGFRYSDSWLVRGVCLLMVVASCLRKKNTVASRLDKYAMPTFWVFLALISTTEGQEMVNHFFGFQAPDENVEHMRELRGTTRDILGFIVAGFFIMLAAGGGIGGGGVLVPTYIFVLGFEPQHAIPLSNVTILGSSISNVVLNARKRHPQADRPLIDWDIMLVMEPLTIAGAVIGSYANVLLPPWVICVMLVLLLGATTVKTFLKGVKMYKKESALKAQEASTSSYYDRMPTENAAGQTVNEESGRFGKWDGYHSEVKEIAKSESKHSVPKILTMLLCTVGTTTFTLLKGGEGVNPLGIVCGTWQYWLISVAVIPFVLIISFFARQYLVKRYYVKERLGWKYLETDVEWSPRNTVVYPLICSVAGLCAGLFGIGGGIVKGPLMLEMGVLPQVSSATTATMILFTSSAASVSYMLFGALNMNYAHVCFPLGLVCTLFGQLALNALVKKYNRSSLIILVIGTIIGMSTIAMGAESSGSLINLFKGVPAPHRSICG